MFYAGVGSRRTPDDILTLMKQLAEKLEREGWVLRTGGAEGADSAFDEGVDDKRNREIYLPGPGFNKHTADETGVYNIEEFDNKGKAYEIARKYHPKFDTLFEFAQKLMARNSYQVLGKNLASPVKFLVCWTPDGCSSAEERAKRTGGTGQAIAVACNYDIPVFNLQLPEHRERIRDYITE